MHASDILQHHDLGSLWPEQSDRVVDVPAAYAQALQVRALRVARGEQPRGFKVGFTNRGIWQRYNVFGPIWGTVWDTSLSFCEGEGRLSLQQLCQPRLEPEIVFGLKQSPPPNATLAQLRDCIEWLAPGFEIVQSHLPDWKFVAADTVADGGLHGRLLVGPRLPVDAAQDAATWAQTLSAARVELLCNGQAMESGQGSAVLDGPLQALHHFLLELRACPGAPDLCAGDVVTTGTWTDAWPLLPGQVWQARFDSGLGSLQLSLS